MSPATASRQRLLRRLVETRQVTSQRELVDLLDDAGHAVTQATVSRDLVAVGATKQRNGDVIHYVITPEGHSGADPDLDALAGSVAGFVTRITPSGNLVVLRTPPGAAQMVAGAIDRAALEDVIGTVAGDDTVLVVAEAVAGGESVARDLEEMGAGR